MKNRFTTLCGRKLPVTFGTFHAVYFSILKYAYNYTVDNIIKDEVREQIIKDAVERSNIETEDINETINLITGEISRIKTEGIDIDAYYSTNCPQEEFKSIFRRYESELKRKRLIDFDDMLLYCRELFLQRKDILLKWQQRYKYILIDEFQDINKVQYDVIRMLAEPERNIFIVGDDDQSIYRFRGADISNILSSRGSTARPHYPSGAELPLYPEHSGRGQRCHPPQRGPQGQDAVDGEWRRRKGDHQDRLQRE